MTEHFNIAVIGSGPGGYVAALKAAQMGAKTAVVERHPFFGGTCLNWGCIPSKALLASAELLHRIQHAGEMGIGVGGPATANWSKIQERKDKAVKSLRAGIKGLFAARKITTFQGSGALDGPGRIAVRGKDGSAADTLTADAVILATGSVPSRIPGWPTDPDRVCTSDESLHWTELPKRLLVVGGGVIGCEFACMLRPFGVEVAVVEMMPRLLPEMDASLSEALLPILKARGIQCFVDTKVEDLVVTDDGIRATLTTGQTIEADKALVATGRRPNTAETGLESAGLATDRGFLRVNDKMETPLKGHYCVGDANGRRLLAHAASAQGVTAVENALGANRSFSAPIPLCVYTFPEIAAIGMTQDEARQRGIPVAMGRFPLNYLGKAMAAGETDGFVEVVKRRDTGELLGVHAMGHNVTEIIAAAGALLHQRATVKQMAEVVFAHPTISEAFKEAAEDALGAALHLPPRRIPRLVVGEQ